MSHSKRIGYWWSEKKSQKINVTELEQCFADKGYEFVKIDIDSDIESQGPFDAIIHKLSDMLCKADRDEVAVRQLNNFERYTKEHPEVIIFDTFDNIRKVLDRSRQYKIIEDSELAIEDEVFTPTFVELTSTDVEENLRRVQAANVKFPFVCKPIYGQGTPCAHKMSIIFNENGLKSINPPCVAQTFINHNARLFKLFIIKDKYFVIERPSIKNFKPNNNLETVHFDSHDISKPYSCSSLTELDEEDVKMASLMEPDKERLDRIVKVITNEVGLFLLGIDVIIENVTGRYAIIDMNSFPGYDGVENFHELCCHIVIEEIEKVCRQLTNGVPHHNKFPEVARKKPTDPCLVNGSVDHCLSTSGQNAPNALNGPIGAAKQENAQAAYDFDSGIDTSDSCDERKNSSKSSQPLKMYKKQHCRVVAQVSSLELQTVSDKKGEK